MPALDQSACVVHDDPCAPHRYTSGSGQDERDAHRSQASSTIRSAESGVSDSAPDARTTTKSSVRMPNRPGRYTPGSTVTVAPAGITCSTA